MPTLVLNAIVVGRFPTATTPDVPPTTHFHIANKLSSKIRHRVPTYYTPRTRSTRVEPGCLNSKPLLGVAATPHRLIYSPNERNNTTLPNLRPRWSCYHTAERPLTMRIQCVDSNYITNLRCYRTALLQLSRSAMLTNGARRRKVRKRTFY